MYKFKLERRGNAAPAEYSNIKNYRCGVYSYVIPGESGRKYSAEFTGGNVYETRYHSKTTGNMLKKPVREAIYKNVLFVSLSYENAPGDTHGDLEQTYRINAARLPYSIQGIEAALQIITGKKCTFDGFTN